MSNFNVCAKVSPPQLGGRRVRGFINVYFDISLDFYQGWRFQYSHSTSSEPIGPDSGEGSIYSKVHVCFLTLCSANFVVEMAVCCFSQGLTL